MATQREKLEKQKAQIEARLKALEARESAERRKKDTRRKIVVGGAVLAHAAHDPAFAETLRAVLGVAVTRLADRKAIADVLGEDAERKGTDDGRIPQIPES
jgi:glucose/arabinose dehydrogenase